MTILTMLSYFLVILAVSAASYVGFVVCEMLGLIYEGWRNDRDFVRSYDLAYDEIKAHGAGSDSRVNREQIDGYYEDEAKYNRRERVWSAVILVLIVGLIHVVLGSDAIPINSNVSVPIFSVWVCCALGFWRASTEESHRLLIIARIKKVDSGRSTCFLEMDNLVPEEDYYGDTPFLNHIRLQIVGLSDEEGNPLVAMGATDDEDAEASGVFHAGDYCLMLWDPFSGQIQCMSTFSEEE